MEKSLGEKIFDISNSITPEVISQASNEELMGYLFLVKKMKIKLEEAVKLEKGE